MRKSVKVVLIIASSLVGIGILCICLAVAFGGTDFILKPQMDNSYTKLTTGFEDDIEIIDIYDTVNDVTVLKSDSDSVKITYYKSDSTDYKITCSATGVLKVQYNDFRKWYQYIGFFSSENNGLIVEVPDKIYKSIEITTTSGDIDAKEINALKTNLKSTSGDVETGSNLGELTASSTSGNVKISVGATVSSANVSTTSGEISVSGKVSGDLDASSLSGDIMVTDLSAEDLNLSCTSGEIKVENLTLVSAEFDTISGDVKLKNVICTGDLEADTTSGEIDLEYVDANKYNLNSTSGKIDAQILKSKIYNVNTISGRINIPQNVSTSKGYFNAETTSGNIEVEVINN